MKSLRIVSVKTVCAKVYSYKMMAKNREQIADRCS